MTWGPQPQLSHQGAPTRGSQPVAHAASRGYNVAIGYLRGFLVILVLAHHSAVAYFWGVPTSRAPLLKTPMLWRAFPVVDAHAHSALLTLFVSFNDTFFMVLMFFVSGLFVWPSMIPKENASFLRDRLKRLGIPFLSAAAIVAPLAYYPSYLIAGGPESRATSMPGFRSAPGPPGQRGSSGFCSLSIW